MNNLDKQYQQLLQDILDNGMKKEDRTGTGTISVFGRQIRHKMSEGFPLLTTKKMAWKTIVTELLWFLRGDTNIKFLIDNGCHIWDGDAYKNYLKLTVDTEPLSQEKFINKIKQNEWEFAKTWGDLGPIYGKQWRNWHTSWDIVEDKSKEAGVRRVDNGVDQIQNLINDLKTNPDSRRLMVNAWNVGELDQMVLPPCHYGFQVYTRELSEGERGLLLQPYGLDPLTKEGRDRLWEENNLPTRAISLMWNQRSVDTFLGLPFNIASYGLLLEIIAKEVNMIPDELIGNLGDVHLYSNHIEQAKEQIGRFCTHEERVELLKQSMGEESYNKAVSELVPFGGGISEYYEIHKIPTHSRQPFELPTLKILDSNVDDIAHYEIADFEIKDYQSHPKIKAPLSN
jgi:thymidylate synthase